MKMMLKDGKRKVLTLSYDDAPVQDMRLIGILNKYGIKGTFNINTYAYHPENEEREVFSGKMKLSEARSVYLGSGHEIAVHGLTHPLLEKLAAAEMIYEITEDRKSIERDYGCIARGMAYPYGTYSDTLMDVAGSCGIVYSRTAKQTEAFGFPENWMELHPTCHHANPKLWELITSFVEKPNLRAYPKMFYMFGHSWEFDKDDNWNLIEEFAEYAGGREDIWYATNIEIYDYVMAYKSLHISIDGRIIHNPSAAHVWFDTGSADTPCPHHIAPGETLRL